MSFFGKMFQRFNQILPKTYCKHKFSTKNCLNGVRHSVLHNNIKLNCSTIYYDASIISGSDDSCLRIWDSETGKCKQILDGHTKPITSVTTFKYSIVSGSMDHDIRIWSEGSNGDFTCSYVLSGHTAPITCVHIFHIDNHPRIISGSSDGMIIIWDNSDIPGFILNGHTSDIISIKTVSETRFITESKDNTLKIWDINSFKYTNSRNFNSNSHFPNTIRSNMHLL